MVWWLSLWDANSKVKRTNPVFSWIYRRTSCPSHNHLIVVIETDATFLCTCLKLHFLHSQKMCTRVGRQWELWKQYTTHLNVWFEYHCLFWPKLTQIVWLLSFSLQCWQLDLIQSPLWESTAVCIQGKAFNELLVPNNFLICQIEPSFSWFESGLRVTFLSNLNFMECQALITV